MSRTKANVSPSDLEHRSAKGKRRICYFLHGGGIGGASLSLLYLLQQMNRERYEPVVILLSDGPLRGLLHEMGVETTVVHGMGYFSHTTGESLSLRNPRGWLQVLMFLPSVWQTYRLVKRLNPAIVHLNSVTLVPQAIGAKLAGAKVVWHIREHVVNGLFGVRRALIRLVARHFADALVAIGEDQVQRLGAPEKTRLIYNFVDFSVFDRGRRDSRLASKTSGPKTVAMLGGISNIKGTLELVQAYPLVQQRVGAVRFMIAGDDGTQGSTGHPGAVRRWLRQALGRDKYIRQVHECVERSCRDGVVFLGVVDDIPGLLSGTDLVVFPSTVPHFPRPAIEAGAMAIPVVASDLEGPREVVQHGETGLLVPPGDPGALADSIARVLCDDGLARTLGEGGYSRARRLFSAEANSQATFAVYEALLHASAPAKFGEDDDLPETATLSSYTPARIRPLWVVLFLAWLLALFGTYFYKMMTIPGRWEKLQAFVSKILT